MVRSSSKDLTAKSMFGTITEASGWGLDELSDINSWPFQDGTPVVVSHYFA